MRFSRSRFVLVALVAGFQIGCGSRAVPAPSSYSAPRIDFAKPGEGRVYKPREPVEFEGRIIASSGCWKPVIATAKLYRDAQRTKSEGSFAIHIENATPEGEYVFKASLPAPMKPGRLYALVIVTGVPHERGSDGGVPTTFQAATELHSIEVRP